jgi:ATP-dependent Clp protease ATP-binding subunit ClpA
LLLSILRDQDNLGTQILNKFDVNYETVKEMLEYQNEGPMASQDTDDQDDDSSKIFGAGGSGASGKEKKGTEKSRTPVLDNFGRDLTRLAEDNKLDPIVGREKEIERVAQILSRRKKNNPILIGEPGVGKTAIAEGLAELNGEPQAIFDVLVPEVVRHAGHVANLIAGNRTVATLLELDEIELVGARAHLGGDVEPRLERDEVELGA